jgi:hypothetical protein
MSDFVLLVPLGCGQAGVLREGCLVQKVRSSSSHQPFPCCCPELETWTR